MRRMVKKLKHMMRACADTMAQRRLFKRGQETDLGVARALPHSFCEIKITASASDNVSNTAAGELCEITIEIVIVRLKL
ncbi:hypothetical protein EVAR_28028_1 [Eumeta japonica]|uniref:Uncharacterized protein n=1 Tax=Eumeta variegata TaxID=151549 RepID=A0A4C1WDV5_EUMVA|nr:hypothetical protein EVAR_28028_1 [Eumeta japonica]